jgi:hypothetical protein
MRKYRNGLHHVVGVEVGVSEQIRDEDETMIRSMLEANLDQTRS